MNIKERRQEPRNTRVEGDTQEPRNTQGFKGDITKEYS
jgi:hypothetical protein